jgi:hypothetical protein
MNEMNSSKQQLDNISYQKFLIMIVMVETNFIVKILSITVRNGLLI